MVDEKTGGTFMILNHAQKNSVTFFNRAAGFRSSASEAYHINESPTEHAAQVFFHWVGYPLI